MNTNTLRHFNFNYKQLVLDEIALNGLEGIGFDLLWKHVEIRIASSITTKMKKRFWDCIVNAKCISFYKLPEPLPTIDVVDRFLIIDEPTGQLLDPPDYIDGPYEYHPVDNEYGSCANYHQRKLLDKMAIMSLQYEQVVQKYGSNLVMVASLEERWHALASHLPNSYLAQLTPIHYCILELVGKGRENGQMTVGKTNLTKIVKEPKLLFYNRKQLQKLDLIRVQCLTQVTLGRGIKSLLLRLKRFHKISMQSMPKIGKLHNLTQYLLTKPDYSERCDVILRKGFLTQPECKKLKKTINVFRFNDREEVCVKSSDKKKSDKTPTIQKRRYISLAATDDESSQSEDEKSEEQLECQYKVGVNILRQAYERFLDAGLKGLTQVEMAQLLGIEFYTSRTICRVFRAKNIVREFLEDKGRQRTARYIAVAATAEMDNKYAEERKKLLEYFDDHESTMDTTNIEEPESESDEIPSKKRKLEETDDKSTSADEIEDGILEVKVLDGLDKFNNESLLNSKKSLSLRQLRFANGLLKVIHEKQAVSGYQTLSAFVAARIGEPPMDTKALKLFVQKLVTDGRLKILKMIWPGFHQKYSVLICAPHITSTSPIIKAKYKDICLKSVVSRKQKPKNSVAENINRPLSQFAYPRYMKIQKLHELIMQLTYFNEDKSEPFGLPVGFSSLLTIIPDMTIEFALGNISNVGSSDIAHLKVSDELLEIKLRDAPPDLYKSIIQSRSLQNSIRIGLKILAQLGLVQLLDQVQNVKQNVFFVNRNAKILDTTGVWPRDNVDKKKLEKTYYFRTFEIVKCYWDEVYSISINTHINVDKRERYTVTVPLRKDSEVAIYDTGEYFGDGMGPCGFHSSIFMDIPRLWHTLYLRSSKTVKPKPVKKKIIKPPKEKLKKRKAGKKAKSKTAVDEFKPREKAPKVKQNNSDSNIKWSAHEDEIMLMCKAAITIMSPNSLAGCLKVKNTVARTLLSINDPRKTGRICHRRATYLEAKPNNCHKKDCILNELRRHRPLIQKYEDILRKLKIRYCANMSRFVNESRLLMLELMWIISQVLKRGIFTHTTPCIAVDYEDFHNKYTISTPSANKFYNLYKISVNSDPQFSSLKEGIVLTVMLSYTGDMDAKTAKKVYAIFEEYSEETLRSAIEQLRKCGALAAKEKVLNNQMNRVQFNDIVRSSFKISAFYRRKWISRLNSDFAESLAEILETEVPQTSVKGSPEVNCSFFEMHSCDVLDIVSVTVPVIVGSSGSLIQEEQLNVIDIEIKFKLKSGIAGWKNKSNMKKFSEIYQNCDLQYMETLQKDPVVKYTEDQILDLQDPIISHLNDKETEGATFRELQEICGYDEKTLINKLIELEKLEVIKRVGYFENRLVLIKFSKPWLFNIKDPVNFIIPAPWVTLGLQINYDVLFNWAGVIMNKVFECPGCSIAYLSKYAEFLTTRSVQDLCMFLEKMECVTLSHIELREVDLFSDDDYVPEVKEFNQYESPEHSIVFPVKNSLTKFAYVKTKILELYKTMYKVKYVNTE